MQICKTKSDLRHLRQWWRGEGMRVGLVPTMGYLHEGHLTLVRRARAANDRVIVTVFVNPTQFGPAEDLDTYPRDAARDLDLLRAEGVDAVFLPSPDEMYHPDAQTVVETTELSRILIGKLRPGHFRGVATVVAKLLHLAQPDTAYFGEKDYQQLVVIRTMVRDLDMPYAIEGVATVRDRDGLALSSRNVRLAPEDRAAAPVLNRALDEAEALARDGTTVARLRAWVRDTVASEPRAEVQSVDIRDAESLAPLKGPLDRPAVILLAVRFGSVLLIDQRVVRPET
ncbi:pantoate--beta-alanine ligase [Rhodobacteraceae bacterium CCMM004]|nr:pantoate--beta-alanine ligase [Rhodobacteraceae bacterium CCMM004]